MVGRLEDGTSQYPQAEHRVRDHEDHHGALTPDHPPAIVVQVKRDVMGDPDGHDVAEENDRYLGLPDELTQTAA